MTSTSTFRRAIAVLLISLLTVSAWPAASAAPELPNPGTTGMSRQEQAKLGLQAATEVYKQMPVLPDSSPVTQYVQQLGKRLVKQIPQQYTWPYEFHVVQQKEINAFALPGGQMFVNVGTIAAAKTEAQLAGVMAHEMSHVYMQHTAKSMGRQNLETALGALGSIFGDGAIGTLAQIGAAGAGVFLLKYSRKDEAQADAVGAIIMYKAGYDPMELANFFDTLAKQGGSGPQFLSDHPNPGNRSEAIAKEIRNWPPEKYTSDSAAFAAVRNQAGGVKSYSAQEISEGAKGGAWARQNIESGSTPQAMRQPVATPQSSSTALQNLTFEQIKPSELLTEIHQNGLSISYPSNWSTASTRGSLTIAPKAGTSENAVAYGVIINSVEDPNARSLDDIAQDLIQNLQQSNPGMKRNGDVGHSKINGADARSVDLVSSSPIEQDGRALLEHDWVVIASRPDGSYIYFIFIAPERDFSALQPTYYRMLNSVEM